MCSKLNKMFPALLSFLAIALLSSVLGFAQDKNYDLCLNGSSYCKESLLTESQKLEVRKAELRRNCWRRSAALVFVLRPWKSTLPRRTIRDFQPHDTVVRFGEDRTCRTAVALSQFFSGTDGKGGEAIGSYIVLARNMRDGKIEFARQLATNPI